MSIKRSETNGELICSNHSQKSSDDITEFLAWIQSSNKRINVRIEKTTLTFSAPWYYDEEKGCIRNPQGSFFSIYGIEVIDRSGNNIQQPIIVQNEIGYLGMLMKVVDGVAYFLMQAKIEPGNINKVQLSPTIQATKSNFTQKHGGRKPAFLDYFINAKPENIVVDQIQSEQSSRFLGKRNRNVIVRIEDEIEENENFRWMTLGQIKALMRYDNLVNMDTRTVISCIPYSMFSEEVPGLKRKNEAPSIKSYVEIFNYINNYKMHSDGHTKLIPLSELKDWEFNDSGEFVCKHPYPFKMIFCDISIEGREVKHWCQPLFEAEGIATFGLIYKMVEGIASFLVQAKPEIGCFDQIELAPSVQLEYGAEASDNTVNKLFFERLDKNIGVKLNVLLSEEGGRFYHEQNRNILMRIDEDQLCDLPERYFWCSFTTLNMLCQVNNVLNIQLRNLLSLLNEDII